ncbi:hypothetical protein HA466_0181750 [Hirschfeldia incana]|nr:hypothetical protein HA466_0181750 [Hirschfeldia incana]
MIRTCRGPRRSCMFRISCIQSRSVLKHRKIQPATRSNTLNTSDLVHIGCEKMNRCENKIPSLVKLAYPMNRSFR